jgi:hypothetical protein
MYYALLADLTVLLHLAFVVFVVAGVLCVAWRPGCAWLHLPALAWGAGVELTGSVCPLTPLENGLRAAAGETGYSGGFVEHYLLPILYPAGLTRQTQAVLGVVVLALNALAYGWLLARRRRTGRPRGRGR